MAFSFEPFLAISAGHFMAVSAGPEHQRPRSADTPHAEERTKRRRTWLDSASTRFSRDRKVISFAYSITLSRNNRVAFLGMILFCIQVLRYSRPRQLQQSAERHSRHEQVSRKVF